MNQIKPCVENAPAASRSLFLYQNSQRAWLKFGCFIRISPSPVFQHIAKSNKTLVLDFSRQYKESLDNHNTVISSRDDLFLHTSIGKMHGDTLQLIWNVSIHWDSHFVDSTILLRDEKVNHWRQSVFGLNQEIHKSTNGCRNARLRWQLECQRAQNRSRAAYWRETKERGDEDVWGQAAVSVSKRPDQKLPGLGNLVENYWWSPLQKSVTKNKNNAYIKDH